MKQKSRLFIFLILLMALNFSILSCGETVGDGSGDGSGSGGSGSGSGGDGSGGDGTDESVII